MSIKINAKNIELNRKERSLVVRLSEEYNKKIKRKIKNNFDIIIHIKAHEKEGSKKKFNIHIDVKSVISFGATADDWDLGKAIHKSMEKILNEIEHKLHSSNQRPRVR